MFKLLKKLVCLAVIAAIAFVAISFYSGGRKIRWFVSRSGDEYITGFADLFTQRICIQERHKIDLSNPFIVRSKENRVVRNFLYFARDPAADVKKEGDKTVVTWRELSYSFVAGDHFFARVVFDKDGKVLKSGFRF